MLKRYSFLSKISGKPAKIRRASSRSEARRIKRTTNRDVVIYDNIQGRVVR